MNKLHMTLPERLFYSLNHIFTGKRLDNYPSAYDEDIHRALFSLSVLMLGDDLERQKHVSYIDIKKWVRTIIEQGDPSTPREVRLMTEQEIEDSKTLVMTNGGVMMPALRAVVGLCLNKSYFLVWVTDTAGYTGSFSTILANQELSSLPKNHPVYPWAIRWREKYNLRKLEKYLDQDDLQN